MKNIRRRCNLMVDLSKFTLNKKILNKKINFITKFCPKIKNQSNGLDLIYLFLFYLILSNLPLLACPALVSFDRVTSLYNIFSCTILYLFF